MAWYDYGGVKKAVWDPVMKPITSIDWSREAKELVSGEPGKPVTQAASPEQAAQYQQYLASTPGMISDALKAAQGARTGAAGVLNYGQGYEAVGQLPSTAGGPQAQTQFGIGGATQYGPDGKPIAPQYQQVQAQRPGELTTAMTGLQGFAPDQSVTSAQQNLAGVMGGLGAFTQGAGTGQSAATLAQSAALGKMQETSMANALGQLREQGFTGAATAGGMGNLAAMAAAQSAGQFAQQRAGLLESERQAALQAAGMQGQFAQGMGQLGLGAGQQRLGALTSMGGLASEESGRMLQAGMANQDAAARAAQLAQQGDIAGAELALKGTGLNMEQAAELNRMNTQRAISNQGAQLTVADINAQNARARAGILAQSPEMQALEYQIAYGRQLAPYQGITGGTPGPLEGVLPAAVGGGVEGYVASRPTEAQEE